MTKRRSYKRLLGDAANNQTKRNLINTFFYEKGFTLRKYNNDKNSKRYENMKLWPSKIIKDKKCD